jgi:hypothetical protein
MDGVAGSEDARLGGARGPLTRRSCDSPDRVWAIGATDHPTAWRARIRTRPCRVVTFRVPNGVRSSRFVAVVTCVSRATGIADLLVQRARPGPW